MSSNVYMHRDILVCDRCKATQIVMLPAPVEEFLAECRVFEKEHEGCEEREEPKA